MPMRGRSLLTVLTLEYVHELQHMSQHVEVASAITLEAPEGATQ